MIEIKDCLPQHAMSHFVSLRNIRLEVETKSYQLKLIESRQNAAAHGVLKSGFQQAAEWQLKEKMFEELALGYVEDVLETCKLYDITVTHPFCERLLQAVNDLLVAQYKNALQAHAQGISDVRIPLSVRSRMGNLPRFPGVLNRVRVILEKARVEDEKARRAMMRNSAGNTYSQTINQYGGVMNASQTGNVYVQQLTAEQLNTLRPGLAAVRAALKAQGSLDADENVGVLAKAEKAAGEGDEDKMLGILKQIPAKVWDIGKGVLSGTLLAYLKAHGIIP